MRLLNVRDLRMEEFFGEDAPPYAILSHTWGDDEVTFQDRLLITTGGTRYAKIHGACAQAFFDGLEYIWIDTICIDKTSSAELSEAINSMFAWYRGAQVCYTYLVDVPDDGTYLDVDGTLVVSDSFRQSRLFTRGWTLQELLAPASVTFYSTNWKRLGTKAELSGFLWQITGIPERYLTGQTPIYVASISQRMSWMSKRVTTRVEDMAYSLLGIFDIYMPLIYGEGRRAFLRLQEEILKSSHDQSIFCWEWDRAHVPDSWASILAPYPAVFAKAAEYVPTSWDAEAEVVPYDISNAGLRIRLPLVPTANPRLVLAVFEVRFESMQVRVDDGLLCIHRLCIPLQKDRVYRRLPFPTRPFPLYTAMVTTKKSIYVMSWERSPQLRRSYITAMQEQAELYAWAPFQVGFLFACSSQPTKLEIAYSTRSAAILESRGIVHFIDALEIHLDAADVFAAMVVQLTFRDEISFILLAMRRNAVLARSPMNFYARVLSTGRCAWRRGMRAIVVEMKEAIGQGLKDVNFTTDGAVTVALGDRVPSGSEGQFVKLVQVVYRDADKSKMLREKAELMGTLIAG